MKILKFDFVTIDETLPWGSEQWLISAHDNGMSKLSGTNITLKELFVTQPELFGNIESDKFPLLMKVIDAETPLSVQVHPNDEYAQKYEDSLGKTECWYILDSKESDIIVGQTATSREELQEALNSGTIDSKLNIFPIKKDDFFYIPAGTVHAIRSNTKILEIQQSSDITYRLYDYDRVDNSGNKRELHIEKSLDVINYEYKFIDQEFVSIDGVTKLVESEFFNVYKLDVEEKFNVKNNSPFIIGYVLEGNITINDEKTNSGEAFLIPNGIDMECIGTGKIIISCL